MKILIANKFYYPRGGDCVYALNLKLLLEKYGHEIAFFSMQYPINHSTKWSKYFPSEIKFKLGPHMFETLMRPFGTAEVKRKFAALLDDFRPDVVHLNNIHTQLSPTIAELAHEKGIRVVWTLHDYKLLCPRYDCLKGGKIICEECFNGDKSGCKTHKCMKDSIIASWLGYKEAIKWNRQRIEKCTDIYICPSHFMKKKMVQGGFSEEKTRTLCNFIDIKKCRRKTYEKDNYYCFIGRLSHEKGVKTLINVANTLPYKLVIIGEGPLEAQLKKIAKSHIEFRGFKYWDEIKDIVGKAQFSVIPSEWYENNPFSVIEAQCLGTPVLGARIGGIPELIKENITGMTFEARNIQNLKVMIEKMFHTHFEYKQIAATSMLNYDADNYYHQILKIYQNS